LKMVERMRGQRDSGFHSVDSSWVVDLVETDSKEVLGRKTEEVVGRKVVENSSRLGRNNKRVEAEAADGTDMGDAR